MKVKLTQIRSVIGHKAEHRAIMKALGLRRIRHTVEKEVNPAVAGMIHTVSYLLKVEEVK